VLLIDEESVAGGDRLEIWQQLGTFAVNRFLEENWIYSSPGRSSNGSQNYGQVIGEI
jgi:hypothetical protein